MNALSAQITFATGSLLAACLLFAQPGASREPDAPEKPEATIRFVAYNVHNYILSPTADEVGHTTAKPQREIEALVRHLAALQPDILGICEMGQESDLLDFQLRLKKAGCHLPHYEWVEAADRVRHTALLSKFPIRRRQSVKDARYTLDAIDLPVQRGFLDVTVEVSAGYPLRLLGAHLKSQRDAQEGEQSLMRRNEAHLLRQRVDAILREDPETNLLVYGDFNETKDQAGIREIHGQPGSPTSLREILVADSRGERWTYHFEPADEYSRIDYVFASAGLQPEVQANDSFIYATADWREASDHRPLVVCILPFEGRKK